MSVATKQQVKRNKIVNERKENRMAAQDNCLVATRGDPYEPMHSFSQQNLKKKC